MDLDEPMSLLREDEQPAWLLCCAGCIAASTAEIIWLYTTKGYNIYYGIFQKERTPEYRIKVQVFKVSGEQQNN